MVHNINSNIRKSLNEIKEVKDGDAIPLLKLEIIDKEESMGVVGNVNTLLKDIAEVERDNLMSISNTIISMFDPELICAVSEANDIHEVAIIGLSKKDSEIELIIVINDVFSDMIYETDEISSEISFYSKKIEDSINKLLRVNFEEKNNQLYKLLFKKENNNWHYKNFIRNILFPIKFQKENILDILNSENYNFIINEINKYTDKINSDELLISFNYDDNKINDLSITATN